MQKKKLSLRREVIRTLTDLHLREAAGGIATWCTYWDEASCVITVLDTCPIEGTIKKK